MITNQTQTEIEKEETEALYGAKRYASQTMWIKEAQDIPIEELNPSELTLMNKLLNKETLTDEQLDDIEQILIRYRRIIHELKPQETLQNVEENIQYVNDEKALLDLLDNQYEVKTITFNYPIKDTVAVIKIDIKPLTDSTAITDLVQDLKLFEDTTQEEEILYSKIRTGDQLTPEEQKLKQKVQDKINDKIQQETLQNQMQMCRQFLAKQTTLHDKDVPYETMLEIYDKMQLMYMIQLFQRVMDILDIGNEDIDKLFQENY